MLYKETSTKEKEQFLKFKKRLEIELRNEFRIRAIIRTVVAYCGINRRMVLGHSKIAPIVYVRYLIIYIASEIYGINRGVIAKHLRYKYKLNYVVEKTRERINSDTRMKSDVENLRSELSRLLSG